MTFVGLHYATHRHSHDISDREFLAADVEGVESVGAGGAVFEEVFLGFGEFLARLALRKPLRPRLPPADWMARIRSGLLERLKNGMSRSV